MSNFREKLGQTDPRMRGAALMRTYARRGKLTKMPKHFYEHMRLDAEPRWFRLIPGNYEVDLYIAEEDTTEKILLPFYHYRRHYDQSQRKYLPCSAGNNIDFAPKPCIGCTKLSDSPQDVFAFTAVHLDWYHETPWEKDGEIQINKKTGKPFTNLTLCEGRGCKVCRTEGEESRVFGRRGHLTLAYTHKNYLMAKADKLSRHCRCGEELEVVSMLCPKCGNVMIDMETTDLTDKQIGEYHRDGMVCGKCGRKMIMLDEYDCDCGNPQPLSIFDVDVELSKVSTSDNKTQLDVAFGKPGPLDERYKGDTEPYDFSEIFAPPTIEVQRAIYSYQGPILNAPEDSVSESYGG